MIIKICVLAIVGTVVLSLVKSNSVGYGTIIQVCIVIVVLLSVVPSINTLLQSVNSVNAMGTASAEGIKIMLKIFSILTVGTICADICRDNGESAIADTVELTSKIIAVVCAVPIISSVVAVAASFLEG